MQTSYGLIENFMTQIEENLIFNIASEVIKAYEAVNLPVPIRKVYFSFATQENKVEYFTDENAVKMEKNDIAIRMNCFVPLKISPSYGYVLSEIVSLFLSVSNSGITGFTIGETEYDSDVDAYKITTLIYYSATDKATEV